MSRASVALVALACVAAAGRTRAQTPTTEGVAAFLHGDYGQAAKVFIPAVNDPWRPDPIAEFFLAVMYDGGLGVPADAVRACALYVHATTSSPSVNQRPAISPFGTAAMALVHAKQRSLGPEAFAGCNWQANFGTDHEFAPVTFTLGPGHWVSWDVRGASVRYEGAETRTELPLAAPFAVFLPLRHTELASGAAGTVPRHFVEVFTWRPAAQANRWILRWTVFEVVGDRVLSVATQEALTVSGERPPAVADADLAAMVRLGVNDYGEVEWAVLNGPSPARGVIPSDTERNAEHVKARAHAAAEARVDWRARRDPRRIPATWFCSASRKKPGVRHAVPWRSSCLRRLRTDGRHICIARPFG